MEHKTIRSEFKDLVEDLHEKVQLNMKRDGYILPVVFLLSRKGMGIVGGGFSNDREKEMFVEGVREVAKENHAIGAIFASESWGLKGKTEDKKEFDELMEKYGSVSKCPNRMEMIIITEEYLDEYYMTTYEIIRDEKGEVKELRKEMSEKSERKDMGGRFTNLLGKPSGDELMAELEQHLGKGQ